MSSFCVQILLTEVWVEVNNSIMTVVVLYGSLITLEYHGLDGLIALYEHSLQKLLKNLTKIKSEINWRLTRDTEKLMAIKLFNCWIALLQI